MRLLIDQNLSPYLVELLRDLFPETVHVRELGLEKDEDSTIWKYAREHSRTIVSKDADFHQRSFLLGQPPKVIWIRLGNCSTREVEALVRASFQTISAFHADEQAAILILPFTQR